MTPRYENIIIGKPAMPIIAAGLPLKDLIILLCR
jgi:hypothetical protein